MSRHASQVRKIMLILLVVSPILGINCNPPPNYVLKLNTRIAAGEMPDLAFIDAQLAPEFIVRGWLRPLPEGAVENLGDFYPQLLSYFQYEGQTYGVPYDFHPVVLLINRDLFDKHGVQVPTNWDQLVDAAAIIQEGERDGGNEGFYGLGLTPGMWDYMSFLYQAGGSLLDEDGALALDTDQAKTAFKFFTGLSRNGLAFPPSGVDSAAARFAQGEIAMCFGGPGLYRSLKEQQVPVEAVGALEMPGGDGPATVALARGYGLFRKELIDEDPNPAAEDFFRFLTSAEAMERWIGDGETPPYYLPTRPSLRSQWEQIYEENYTDAKAFMEAVDYLPELAQTVLVPYSSIDLLGALAAQKIEQAMQPDLSDDDALVLLEELRVEGNEILQANQE